VTICVRFAPAIIRRAFFVLGAACASLSGAVPLSAPPELAQIMPSAAEIAQILAQFRQTGIQGDYYLEFELRAMPRKGEEATWAGKMWGSRNTEGTITRVALSDGGKRESRLLVQNGAQPAVWRWQDGKTSRLEIAALFQPVVPGVDLTAFDLQMPFLHWPNPLLEKLTRMRGRPAHVFVFRPPTAFAAQYPELGAVRVYLDTQYNAPTQIESLNREPRIAKTVSLLDLKKVGEQWIPKSFEARNEMTRDKTRVSVTAAGLGLAWPSGIFAPSALGDPVSPPATERVMRIAP
jgi:hypothetical protein